MAKRKLSGRPDAGETGSRSTPAENSFKRATFQFPYDIDELAKVLRINAADRELLRQIADEAVNKFDSDEEAVRWFDAEVLSRNPNLWWSIGEAVRSKQR